MEQGKKVKWSRYRPDVAQRVGRGIALLFLDHGTRRGWVVSSTPWPHFTPGKNRYPFYRRLGGPQGRSGWAENLIPTGIRSQTVQPVVSRYTNWATWPTLSWSTRWNVQQFSQKFWSLTVAHVWSCSLDCLSGSNTVCPTVSTTVSVQVQ